MSNARTMGIILCAVAWASFGACKKSGPASGPAGGPADTAAKDTYEPPPPPPPLHDAEVSLPDGWRFKLRVPEGFTDDGKGTFETKGAVLAVQAACTDPCGHVPWLAKSADIVGQIIAAYSSHNAAGNAVPPQIEYNNRVSEGRYEFALTVPSGGGLLDEPSLAGGVILFDDAWPKYVTCQWSVGFEPAPTLKPALTDACKTLQVVAMPPQ